MTPIPRSGSDAGADPVESPGRGASLARILALVGLASWLVVLLVQIPGLGNIDTARRLQVTRAFWTTEPPVRPGDYPEFGIRNREGVVHAWYGIGQSLLMLPADLVAAPLERRASSPEAGARVRSGVVATLTFPLLNAATVVLVVWWLLELGFNRREAVAGGLSLLVGSTFLHYAQVHMENSCLDFLMFADACCMARWAATGRRRWLALASGTVAFALLVRLPALAEHAAVWMVAGVLAVTRAQAGDWRSALAVLRPARILGVAVPLVGLGALADRLYHHHRFGTWTGTYIGLQSAEARAANPSLPENWVFSGDFLTGFLGPLVGPDRSVFLFDPLLWLVAAGALIGRRRLPLPVRAALVAGAGTLLLLVAFHARCIFWDGGASWSSRYALGPVHFMAALALPMAMLLARSGVRLPRVVLGGILAAALGMQALSLALPNPLERAQTTGPDRRPFLPALRLRNLGAKLAGEAPPARVPEGLWRINLAPATLSGTSPARQAIAWTLWAGGVLLAGWIGRLAWRQASGVEGLGPFARWQVRLESPECPGSRGYPPGSPDPHP